MKMSTPKNQTRSAFKMKLKPGYAEEYKRRHDSIWPDLSVLLREAGISDYAIFLDEETNTLFAVQKVDTTTSGSQGLGHHPIVKKWWAHMADIMETNADHSPVAIPLREVFYLD
jgi:L-rhamnose mutarotase